VSGVFIKAYFVSYQLVSPFRRDIVERNSLGLKAGCLASGHEVNLFQQSAQFL